MIRSKFPQKFVSWR